MELKLGSITDSVTSQAWFQEIKTKWEELDPQSRQYLKIAGGVLGAFLVVYLLFGSLWHVHKLKTELADRRELLTTIQSANEEMRRIRDSGTPPLIQTKEPWPAYFETIATNAGIEKSVLNISPEKSAGGTGDVAKESFFELSLKKASIRQVVKLAYFLEAGTRPVKVRGLSIDTNADPTGFLDATVSVSAFSAAETKAGK